MEDVLIVSAVLGFMLLCVDQTRRLISCAIINRTIRKALELDPASARLLIEQVERPRRSAVPAGWTLAIVACALAALCLSAEGGDRLLLIQLASVSAIGGAGILGYAWWVRHASKDKQGPRLD